MPIIHSSVDSFVVEGGGATSLDPFLLFLCITKVL